MQWKKIVAAGSLSFLMAGSTLAFAQLETYPAPFVTSSGPDALVVVGAAAAPSDVVGAIDVAARLGGEVTTDVAVGSNVNVETVQGEGKSIHTENEKIYLGDNLRKTGLRTAMSDTDLPTLLKSDTVTDSDQGTTYDFDQFVDFSDDYTLTFNKISGDLPDPTYMFGEFTTSPSTTNYVYRSRVVFNDEVNGTTVVGEKITLFGNRYTFSSGTNTAQTTPKVELFGGADTKTLTEGETVTVDIDGTTYNVKLLVVSDADTVGMQVGSDSKSIDKGKSATVGGLEVFVDDVFFSSKEGTTSSASVLLGARRLILEDGAAVKTKVGGESEKTLDGTLVDVTTSSGRLTGIDIYAGGQSSKDDFLKVGGTYLDPAWKTFKLAFTSVTSEVKASTRDTINVLPSGTKDTDLIFTNDRGDRGTIKWAHLADSSDTTPDLADDNGDQIVVIEGAPIDRNEYFVVDSGDFSRIFEVTSASSLGTSDATVDIRDIMSGKTTQIKLGTINATSKVIDGQTYLFNASGATTTTDLNMRVFWGNSAVGNSTGDFLTAFPTLKTQRGAKIALTEPVSTYLVTTTGGTNRINLPTGAINASVSFATASVDIKAITTEKSESSAIVGTNVTIPDGTHRTVTLGRSTTGGTEYNMSFTNATGLLTIRLLDATGNSVDPAMVLVEEQDDSSNVYSIVVAADTETRSSNEEMSPQLTSGRFSDTNVKSAAPDTDSDLTKFVDTWGTYAESNSRDQNRVWIWYPDFQISANVYLLDKDATVSTSSGGVGTVKSATPIKTALGKLDSEVTSADKSTKSLILVGGPVVNSLVAELATAGKTWDTATYRAQGEGTAIINYVANAFTSGKAALVVAGHSAPDTRVATSWLQDFGAHSSDLMGSLVVLKNGVKTTVTT